MLFTPQAPKGATSQHIGTIGSIEAHRKIITNNTSNYFFALLADPLRSLRLKNKWLFL